MKKARSRWRRRIRRVREGDRRRQCVGSGPVMHLVQLSRRSGLRRSWWQTGCDCVWGCRMEAPIIWSRKGTANKVENIYDIHRLPGRESGGCARQDQLACRDDVEGRINQRMENCDSAKWQKRSSRNVGFSFVLEIRAVSEGPTMAERSFKKLSRRMTQWPPNSQSLPKGSPISSHRAFLEFRRSN